MHYNRRDSVWNGAGHQSRAPFEKMMHWGETQTHIRLQRVSRNDPRISTIFYHYVSRQDAVKHAQIWLKWEMNWTKERWHFCYCKGLFWVGRQSWSSLLGQVFWDRIVMFALLKVSARTAFADHLTWGPIDWGNWSRPGSWCTASSVYLMECHICVEVDINAWWSMFITAVSPGWAMQYKHPQMC